METIIRGLVKGLIQAGEDKLALKVALKSISKEVK